MEPFYRRKLLAGIRSIQRASLEDLRDPTFVANLIRQTGLRYDRRGIYGPDDRFTNPLGPGLWQIPEQLAKTLVVLGGESISSALEIGTCDGWTGSVMAAYLQRFQPGLRFVTIDIAGKFVASENVRKLVPVEYHGSSSVEDFEQEHFDLVFIDGNHDYDWVRKDYELSGRKARICMFHDVNDLRVGAENVPQFWKELKTAERDEAEFFEFFEGPEGVMGIGIRKKLKR